MPYKYADFREGLFTDEGQRTLIRTRDKVFAILKQSGVITMEKAAACSGSCSNWDQMAYIDRMVEMGDLRETDKAGGVTQNRMFVLGNKHC